MIRAYSEGGLKIVDIESLINALKPTTFKRYFKKNKGSNNILRLRHIYPLGSNIGDSLSHMENPYWRDVSTAWGILHSKHEFDNNDIKQIMVEPLWLHHHFESSYIIRHWFHHGVNF